MGFVENFMDNMTVKNSENRKAIVKLLINV